MKIKFLVFLLLSVCAVFNVEAKVCKKGQPCGNSCISWNKTCHKGTYSLGSSSSYSSRNSSSVSPANQSNYASYYIVTASSLNVRNSPSPTSKVIGEYKKGDEIMVLSSENGWAKIRYKSVYAWVSYKYLKRK
ncbi:SH3 domain-containing protein [Celerinatantimonas sp. MCCC 1A17872]|uniref:SH3 domain-containing protein n=1 Tax=Celerinatantimonas sp. MCCC 1A17872 TaxID=3177514 RepID=UPI0038C73408